MLARRYRYSPSPAFALNKLQRRMKAQVEHKLKTGNYRLEANPCCVCQGNDFEAVAEKDRYGFAFSVVICKNCGLMQTNPRMDVESYGKFYDHEYRRLYSGAEAPSLAFFQSQYERGGEIFDYLDGLSALPSQGTGRLVLEVGCGAGGILKYFQDQGFRIKGIDLGTEYLAYGRDTFGLDLSAGSLADLSLDELPCLIIYSHVLEHLLVPRRELATIHERLAEDGVLYVEVPGVKNVANAYDSDFLLYLQNAHTYHFTLTTLCNMLHQSDFQLHAGDEVVRSVFRKRPAASQAPRVAVENDYPMVLDFLASLERWRWLRDARRIGRRATIETLRSVGAYGFAKNVRNRLFARDRKAA
jgi:SAM-dependent methyltransferase